MTVREFYRLFACTKIERRELARYLLFLRLTKMMRALGNHL